MVEHTNTRHIAAGIEAIHNSVRMVATSEAVDLHVYDLDELNSVLTQARDETDIGHHPHVYPHESGDSVGVRIF